MITEVTFKKAFNNMVALKKISTNQKRGVDIMTEYLIKNKFLKIEIKNDKKYYQFSPRLLDEFVTQ